MVIFRHMKYLTYALVAAGFLLLPMSSAMALSIPPLVHYEGQEEYDRLSNVASNFEFDGPLSTLTDDEKNEKMRNAIEAELHYTEAGTEVSLAEGAMKVKIPDGYRFLDKGQALFLFEITQNRELTSDLRKELQGILVTNGAFLSQDSVIVFIEYYDEGYISDEDAASIDGEAMAAESDKEDARTNALAGKDDFTSANTVWLQKPTYNIETHTFSFSNYFDEILHGEVLATTVNADVIALGRGGYYDATVVATKDHLDIVPKVIADTASSVVFSEGHTYADYNPATDKKSNITIGQIAAGVIGVKLLAKLGVWAVIAKFGKIIVVAVLAFSAKIRNGVKNIFKSKKE
jgi:uncharacterized membrane-anchored protein